MRKVLALVAAVLLSACSTVYVHADRPDQLYPYKGTQTAAEGVSRAWNNPVIPGEAPVRAMIDVPLCVVTDTILLPIDWLVWVSNSH